MNNSKQNYPKQVWVLTQAQVYLVDNREEIDHTYDQVLGSTFDIHVAEKVAAVFQSNTSDVTVLRSNVTPLPSSVLEVLDEENKATSLLDEILND